MVIIKNKSEIPYGVFCNSYNDGLTLEGKNWTNLIDFITAPYGNVSEPIDTNFRKMWESLQKNKINEAIKKAIDAKSIVDPEFEGILLSAENRPILFISEDSYLGVDLYSFQGENVYGKWLTNYKHILMENNSVVNYNIYVLNRFLNMAINYEPLDNYLAMAIKGAGVRKINQVLYTKYGNMIDIPSIEVVEKTRLLTLNEFKYKAEEIILNVMKNKIRKVRVNNLNSYRYKIFRTVVKNIMKENNLQYDVDKFIKKMDLNEREYSVDRIYQGYTQKVLGNEIPIIDPDLYIPNLTDVTRVESLNVKGVENNLPLKNNYALVDSATSRLSLKDDRYIFTVDGKSFPSISHYIIFNIGTLIKGYDPYAMIYNNKTQTFSKIKESTKFLEDNLETFEEFHFKSTRLEAGIKQRINQHPYLIDYLKIIGDTNINVCNDISSVKTNAVLNNIKNSIHWRAVLSKSGSVLNHVDDDDFFIFIQKEMFESFINVLTIIYPGDLSHKNVLKVYEYFYGNIPGTLHENNVNFTVNYENIKQMSKTMNVLLSEKSCEFLKRQFLNRILTAETMSKNLFKSDSLFMTKFLIIESRYKMFTGQFLDRKRTYKNKSLESLAFSKVINAIASTLDFNVLTEAIVDKAFTILSGGSNVLFYDKTPVRVYEKLDNNKKINLSEDFIEEDFIEENQDKDEEDTDDENREQNFDDDEEEDDDYDDLMFAPQNAYLDADEISISIINNLHPSKQVRKYLAEKVDELFNYRNKNIYKINMWQ